MNVSKHIRACFNFLRQCHNCLKYKLLRKQYSRCTIVDFEHINVTDEYSAGEMILGKGEGVHCQDIIIMNKVQMNID